jgi:hypothetical protein
MLTKVCKTCNIEKSIDLFPVGKKYKYGVRPNCKVCHNLSNKEKYYDSEKEKQKYQSNREHKLNKVREYNIINRDKKIEYLKNYREKEENKEKRRHIYKEKIKEDFFRFNKLTRGLISCSFKRKGLKKNSKTEIILGCTIEEFMIYIESKFESWMTWDNRGLYNGELNYGWDIDHIIPISSAKTEYDIIRLNHYTNLQPLCSKINRDIKRNYCNYT